MRAVLRRGRLLGPRGGPRGSQPGGPAAAPPLAVDLRSDTVTRPCAGMRRAMARAAVGDDDYGEDPAVNELQRRAAGILGTESALFVPTATMANLIAVMCHCQRRGAQLFLGRDSHLHLYEHGGAAQEGGRVLPSSGCQGQRRIRCQSIGRIIVPSRGLQHEWELYIPSGGLEPPCTITIPGQLRALTWAQVAGVHSQALPDLPNGTFDLDQLELTIREAQGSRYHPRPELICLENTHSSAGGRALPLTYLRQVRGLADRYGLRVHMDGARLMNAAVAQGVEPAQIAQHCDSVSLCFSKGLGAPCGAVLAGCREFVSEAWRVRKLLGGGMRQAGVLAAAAHLGLRRAEATLRRDHHNARRFAEGIHVLDSPLWSINLAAVETNIVMVNVRGAWPCPAELCQRLRAVSEEEVAETGQAVSVLLLPWSARTLRAVWHRDISAHDTELARRKLEFVARKCQEELALGLHPTPPGTGGA